MVVGGIIPEEDAAELRRAGVQRVYTPKDYDLTRMMDEIVDVVAEARPGLARLELRSRSACARASATPSPTRLNLVDDARPKRAPRRRALLGALERRRCASGAAARGRDRCRRARASPRCSTRWCGARARAAQTSGCSRSILEPASSGGALLGDRVRVRSRAADPGVFLRSLAARDRLGGLAEATRAGVLRARRGFDVVLVETVGVGQSEAEVADLVDTLVSCASPARATCSSS